MEKMKKKKNIETNKIILLKIKIASNVQIICAPRKDLNIRSFA